jgi:protein-tyrosine phosphatase
LRKEYAASGIQFLRIFFEENDLDHFSKIKPKILDFVKTGLDKNENVLIHCAMGQKRSPTIALMILMDYYEYSYVDALKKINKDIPWNVIRDEFKDFLRFIYQ